MSSTADLIALAISLATTAPFLWMAIREDSARFLGPAMFCAVTGIAVAQTGVFQRGSLAPTDVMHLARSDSTGSRCHQVIDLLLQNGVVLERPDSGRMIVRGEAWDTVPEAVRRAIEGCVETAPQLSGEPSDVQIIRR